jgi:DNA adenine methylase
MKRKPFLKWAGNKLKIIERIQRLLPKGERLIEPFIGSGAVFLNTNFCSYLLSDNNADLINLYKMLQAQGEPFIAYCKTFFTPANNTPEQFYLLRTQFNQSTDQQLKAALFVYLNRHCYNGLCRYNASGSFNVPFGSYTKPYFPQSEMEYFYNESKAATFTVCNFSQTMKQAKPGDVIYADPPYAPLSGTANFTSYSAGGFNLQKQQELADLAVELAASGVKVLISNHETDFTIKAYKAAQLNKFEVQRFISCNGSGRKKAAEILALFG